MHRIRDMWDTFIVSVIRITIVSESEGKKG